MDGYSVDADLEPRYSNKASLTTDGAKVRNINDELRRAAKSGDEKSLRSLLLNPKCNALTKDEKNWTALMYAACRGHTSCVQLLLPVSDALVKDNYGTTALMYAACHGHTSCIKLLLPFSDALAKDNDGETALMSAARYGHTSCVQLLLPVSDALVMNKYGKTARSLATDYENDATANLIDDYTFALSELAALSDLNGLKGAPPLVESHARQELTSDIRLEGAIID